MGPQTKARRTDSGDRQWDMELPLLWAILDEHSRARRKGLIYFRWLDLFSFLRQSDIIFIK